GGHRGGAKADVKNKPALGSLGRKAKLSSRGLDPTKIGRDGKMVVTTRGVVHRFEETLRVSIMKVELPPRRGLTPISRSRHGEMRVGALERTVEPSNDGVKVKTRAASAQLNELEIKAAGDTFQVQFTANGLEAAQALALDLSRSLTPQRVLESANVKTF